MDLHKLHPPSSVALFFNEISLAKACNLWCVCNLMWNGFSLGVILKRQWVLALKSGSDIQYIIIYHWRSHHTIAAASISQAGEKCCNCCMGLPHINSIQVQTCRSTNCTLTSKWPTAATTKRTLYILLFKYASIMILLWLYLMHLIANGPQNQHK